MGGVELDGVDSRQFAAFCGGDKIVTEFLDRSVAHRVDSCRSVGGELGF